MWKGKVPSVSYFRNFGCKVFCLDKIPTRGKFDARSKEGIFIGHSEKSKGFRVWMPESKKIEITQNIRFLENHLNASEGPTQDFYPEEKSNQTSMCRKVSEYRY